MKRSFLLASILALMASMNLNATLLSVLVAGGSLSGGGLTFDNFTFNRNCSGVGVCAPLDASGIDVSLVGNQLQFAGGFAALSVGGVATADFLIGYNLLATNAIGAIGLVFNGAVVGDQSFAQVVETVSVLGVVQGQGQVDAPGGPLSALITLNPDLNFMHIVKDIFLLASDSEGDLAYASISFIDQIYREGQPSGDPEPTPEPATYAMMGIGLIGLYFGKRKLS
jgi:hypothetical protein